MDWKSIELHGAQRIARVCGIYEIIDVPRFPWAQVRIKVLEREHDFVARPNMCVRAEDGTPKWTEGVGQSELEALEDAIARVMADFGTRPTWEEQDVAWVHPLHF